MEFRRRGVERMPQLLPNGAAAPLLQSVMLTIMLASCSPETASRDQEARPQEPISSEALTVGGDQEAGQQAPGSSEILLTLNVDEDAGQALVVIRNVSAEPVCVSYNYRASSRLTGYVGAVEVPLNAWEGRPRPGCLELSPSAQLQISYDLRALFPGTNLTELRVCYALPWHTGRSEVGPYRMARICRGPPA
jgi:hypothetical protein